jgi:WD40 repeat protein
MRGTGVPTQMGRTTTKRVRLAILAAMVCLCFPALGRAQQSCVAPLPATLTPAQGTDIFTPQQEVDLGEIQAERVERDVRVIHDDELAQHLNDIAQRLLTKMPPSGLQFHVTLIDLPVVNAFTLSGGRIYVTRKMVAFARSDDELASMLAHEMGHALTHQTAVDVTRWLREVLGITTVGDRKDIFDKWNLILDNAAHDLKAFQKARQEEEPHQYVADQVALYALANAGYSPETFADFFDRLAQTKGKTGGWLTDLFGTTKPNEARLRLIRKSIDSLPAACRIPASPTASPEFLAWHGRVIAYSGLGRKEVLSGVIAKKALDPPLRDDITHLRFSGDGRYVLAQDDASIFVLSRQPLRLLFRVDAPDAQAAQFSPDSTSLVFSTRGLRVEEWNVEDQSQTSIHELTPPGGCMQSRLSPDGKVLACVNTDFDISLIDVGNGNADFERKKYFQPQVGGLWENFFRGMIVLLEERNVELLRLEFSPDDRYFVAGGLGNSLAYDLAMKAIVPMHGGLNERTRVNFTFVAPDKVVAADPSNANDSGLFEFPSGQRLQQFGLGPQQRVGALTQGGGNVIITPLKDSPGGIVDLQGRKVLIALKHSAAVDAYGGEFVIEQSSGSLGFFDTGALKQLESIALPQSPLRRLSAAAVSGDLQWMAVSGSRRGAVWNLNSAKRMYYLRGFQGAYFDSDKAFYADFPKEEPEGRNIGRADLNQSNVTVALPLDEKSGARQWGHYLVERKPGGKEVQMKRNILLDVRDARDDHELWMLAFPKEAPAIFLNSAADTCLLEWPVEDEAASDEIKADPALRERLASLPDRKGAYLVEVRDLPTGKRVAGMIVDTGKGSFKIVSGYAAGKWVGIADTDGRIRIYELPNGEQKGVVFGGRFALSPTAGLLSVENQPGEIDLYRLPSLEKQGQLIFSSPIAMQAFSEDGKRLCVLTQDQIVRLFDTGTIAPAPAPSEVASAAVQ